ncbi:MAG TPA: GAF domain-containing protein [Nevskiaceae bacterium]|nr:GAF domain-containing protein [Nevskiaceae bacterium]
MSHRPRVSGPLDGMPPSRLRASAHARRRSRLRGLTHLTVWPDASVKGEMPVLGPCQGYESAEAVLQSCLASAMEVSGSEGGFFLLSSGPGALEILMPRRLSAETAMDVVLGRAAVAVRQTLRDGRVACTDAQGRALPLQDGFHESNAPACLCVPMELGRRKGLLCLVRPLPARSLGELDLEIVQAVTEQAGLTLSALIAGQALARLEAALCGGGERPPGRPLPVH